jgi:hypothetical protein
MLLVATPSDRAQGRCLVVTIDECGDDTERESEQFFFIIPGEETACSL